jgi:hypothetical protein
MSGSLFRCQTVACRAEYGVIARQKPPEVAPECVRCGRLLPTSSGGYWLYYQPAWPSLLLAPDASI